MATQPILAGSLSMSAVLVLSLIMPSLVLKIISARMANYMVTLDNWDQVSFIYQCLPGTPNSA